MWKYSRIEEIPPEKIDEVIDQAANLIVQRFPGLEGAAIFFIEMNKPFFHFYGELGRFYSAAFLTFFSDSGGANLQQYITIFEQRENLDRLLQKIEDLTHRKNNEKKKEKNTSKLAKIKSLFKKTS